jgi:hypothetical protein
MLLLTANMSLFVLIALAALCFTLESKLKLEPSLYFSRKSLEYSNVLATIETLIG